MRLVRLPGWQGTQAGEREVKKALHKALFKYKLHADDALFEKAYQYVKQFARKVWLDTSQHNNFGRPAKNWLAQYFVPVGIKTGCHAGELAGLGQR